MGTAVSAFTLCPSSAVWHGASHSANTAVSTGATGVQQRAEWASKSAKTNASSANVSVGGALLCLVSAAGLPAIKGNRKRRVVHRRGQTMTAPVAPPAPAESAPDMPVGSQPPVLKGNVSPAQPVPPGIIAPPYVAEPELVRGWWNSRVEVKTPEQVEAMRAAGRLAHAALDRAAELIVPGRTTEEMDVELHKFMVENGAYPSDLQYKGFPKSVMISINEVICHGIPDDRPLQNGDVVNVDVTLYLNGVHADTARTWICGEGDARAHRLVAATKEALDSAVSVVKAGAPFKLVGEAVSSVAEREGFGVVKNLVGHGIGEFFHGVPQVFHCRNSDNRKMQVGTTFTLEPVLTEGDPEWITWSDGWTNATKDRGRTAQFEHTLLVTEDGCEVLT